MAHFTLSLLFHEQQATPQQCALNKIPPFLVPPPFASGGNQKIIVYFIGISRACASQLTVNHESQLLPNSKFTFGLQKLGLRYSDPNLVNQFEVLTI